MESDLSDPVAIMLAKACAQCREPCGLKFAHFGPGQILFEVRDAAGTDNGTGYLRQRQDKA